MNKKKTAFLKIISKFVISRFLKDLIYNRKKNYRPDALKEFIKELRKVMTFLIVFELHG